MAPSSTYKVRSRCDHAFVRSSSVLVYSVDSMGDRGEPCGVPVSIGKASEM